jgi:hypothetical protein
MVDLPVHLENVALFQLQRGPAAVRRRCFVTQALGDGDKIPLLVPCNANFCPVGRQGGAHDFPVDDQGRVDGTSVKVCNSPHQLDPLGQLKVLNHQVFRSWWCLTRNPLTGIVVPGRDRTIRHGTVWRHDDCYVDRRNRLRVVRIIDSVLEVIDLLKERGESA